METHFIDGFLQVFSSTNILFCFIGCLLGTLVGILPGLGPASTLAILLPLTTFLDPQASIIMLAGIYYGAAYGGSTTSILLNIPGEPSSVPTTLDGFQMTLKGRAGQALWISAVGSFIAGTVGALAISFLGPALADFGLKFGPPEFFGLIIFSLSSLVSLTRGSLIKGVIATLVGIFLASVGTDPLTGTSRLNFGSVSLMRGLDLVAVAVGLFGIGEILHSSEQGKAAIYEGKLGKMVPRGSDLKDGLKGCLRGTGIGYILGLLPGMVTAVTTFIAYDVEKRVSRHPEKFGTGVIEGVASPEAANNATAMAGFVPLISLGIPTSPALALILASLMMYGLTPGPLLFIKSSTFVWAVIASLYIGNVILLILNLPLVGVWARISKIPYRLLAPVILAICVVGAYSPRNTMFDVWVAIGSGVLGYLMRKTGWPVAPLILGFILGPMMEQALCNSLEMSYGSLSIFVERPISAFFLLLTAVWIAVVPLFARKRLTLSTQKEQDE